MGTIFADAADPHKLAQLRDTFRGRLSPFPWEADEVLARFLNARKGDANEAATMLEASLVWRQSHPSLLDFCYPEEADVRRAMPQGFHKVDRRGRPVQYQLLGRADAEQLMRATTLERLLEWNVHRAEHTIRVKYPRCAKVAGRPVGQSIVVIDLAGATMSQFSGEVRQYLQQYFQTLGNNFPGNLARVLVLNTPMFFQPVWSVVKRFLPPSDGERITLLGGPSQYEPVLRELIEPASLPRQYGGTDDSFDTSRDDGVWLDEQFAAASAAAMDSQKHAQSTRAEALAVAASIVARAAAYADLACQIACESPMDGVPTCLLPCLSLRAVYPPLPSSGCGPLKLGPHGHGASRNPHGRADGSNPLCDLWS